MIIYSKNFLRRLAAQPFGHCQISLFRLFRSPSLSWRDWSTMRTRRLQENSCLFHLFFFSLAFSNSHYSSLCYSHGSSLIRAWFSAGHQTFVSHVPIFLWWASMRRWIILTAEIVFTNDERVERDEITYFLVRFMSLFALELFMSGGLTPVAAWITSNSSNSHRSFSIDACS